MQLGGVAAAVSEVVQKDTAVTDIKKEIQLKNSM